MYWILLQLQAYHYVYLFLDNINWNWVTKRSHTFLCGTTIIFFTRCRAGYHSCDMGHPCYSSAFNSSNYCLYYIQQMQTKGMDLLVCVCCRRVNGFYDVSSIFYFNWRHLIYCTCSKTGNMLYAILVVDACHHLMWSKKSSKSKIACGNILKLHFL